MERSCEYGVVSSMSRGPENHLNEHDDPLRPIVTLNPSASFTRMRVYDILKGTAVSAQIRLKDVKSESIYVSLRHNNPSRRTTYSNT